ncbi:hypothetical protein [Thermoactinomyces sp. CICC 10522]|jgi:colicin import membrane protein|uniref:hypothetical protein n=1 Tax=Thermoactinomyces sp. CICC 10522 TaxID=2767427 RepID=UPI0018DD7A83|nr:hypothetical protein [Thermoactinomyces sp. CICC 10522]MBH8604040.1 hypothetical protein [Thermoactinomyces sp. CICC 10522]
MAKITERSTKATILAALREAEKRIAELEKGKLDPVSETQAKKTAETIKKADNLMEENIDVKIMDLSKSVTRLLSKISEDILEQTQNLKTVKEAISMKEAELKELYGIEKQAHTLAALVNAHQELKLSQEKELAEEKEKASSELAEILKQIETARKEHESLLKEQKEKLAQLKKREEEEFKYEFARHKKQAHDQLEDELASKRKTFEAELEKRKKELDTYKKSLDEREEKIQKREEKMEELEAEVASIPDKIAQVKKEAKEKADAEMKKVLAIREAAFKKEVEADKRILEKERDNLKNQLQMANETIATLQAKLDEAYKRIQEMGIQMVSSSNESKTFDKIAALVSEKNSK